MIRRPPGPAGMLDRPGRQTGLSSVFFSGCGSPVLKKFNGLAGRDRQNRNFYDKIPCPGVLPPDAPLRTPVPDPGGRDGRSEPPPRPMRRPMRRPMPLRTAPGRAVCRNGRRDTSGFVRMPLFRAFRTAQPASRRAPPDPLFRCLFCLYRFFRRITSIFYLLSSATVPPIRRAAGGSRRKPQAPSVRELPPNQTCCPGLVPAPGDDPDGPSP